MKKYFVLTLILALSVSIAMATELHVGIGQQYLTISAAYNAAQNGDEIIIHPGDYSDHLDVHLDIDIRGSTFNPNDVTIESDYYGYSPLLIDEGTVNISNLTVRNAINGISVFAATVNIENCIVENNEHIGICTSDRAEVTINNCIVKGNGGYGILLDQETPDRNGIIENTLVIDNGFDLGPDYGAGIYMAGGIVSNCTILENKKGVIRRQTGNPTVINSIVYNNELWQIGTYITEVTYSDIQGGFIGTGNIDEDPMFNDDYTLFYESEVNKSPCIDTGDPNAGYDPDGSLADMGCYPYLHDYDTKHFSPGWQWPSFPVLTQQFLYTGSYEPLEDEMYEQAYNENGYNGFLQDPVTGELSINGFQKIEGKRDEEMYIEYIFPTFFDITGFDNMLFRQEGYKIFVEGANPTTLRVYGDRLPVNHTIDGAMNSGEYHWLGFWIPRTQKMIESFGEFWQYVEKVKSEDWFYSPANNQRGGDPTYPVAISAEGLTLEYGKAYLVLFNEQVEGFHWTDTSITVETEKKSEPENFTYTEKADYEAVDVFNIPPNVTEIGVFEDEVCVGAVVVEDTCAQILVYSDNANRDPVPFTFEVVTGRGFSTPIKDYQVLDWETGKFESKSIISGRQEYSVIRFGDEDEPEDNILLAPQLHGNYPNPFNPTTTISFSLPDEQEIKLTIYNIKGQKVKQLINGQLTAGQHSMIWDGKDLNEKPVSSGIYFYKLKTGKKEISRKMLLLK